MSATLDSAGINRHGVANERVVQGRRSEPPWPLALRGGRKAALEAWERGIRRQGIELRNQPISGADAVRAGGRQHEGGRQRETALGPAESQTPGMRRNSRRENRETPVVARRGSTAGRRENAMSGKSLVHGQGESYHGVVPTKQPNKGGSRRRKLWREGRGPRRTRSRLTRAGHRAEQAGPAGWSGCARHAFAATPIIRGKNRVR